MLTPPVDSKQVNDSRLGKYTELAKKLPEDVKFTVNVVGFSDMTADQQTDIVRQLEWITTDTNFMQFIEKNQAMIKKVLELQELLHRNP